MCKSQDIRTQKGVIRYVCDNASRRKVGSMEYKCTNHKMIREEKIEEYLLENVKKVANKYIAKNTITENTPKADNSLKIKNIESKIYKLKDLYLDDLIDKETYKKDYNNLTNQLNNLKAETKQIERKDVTNLQNFINSDFEKIYSSLTKEEKRRLWLNTIDKIFVENNEIKEITFL